MEKFTVQRKVSDLRLKEELDEVYCYIDHNKQTIEPMYNDEIKLPINMIKLVQKQFPRMKISTKKAFGMIADIKILFDKKKYPDDIFIDFEMSF